MLVHLKRCADRALGHAALPGLTAALFSASLSVPANAADPDGDQANVPVRQRTHPEWDARGVAYGDTFFYPSVTAGAEFDSNVFASSRSPQDDFALVIAPELRVQKNGSTSSHELDLGARHYEYERFDSEDRTEAHASLKSSRQFGDRIDVNTFVEAARRFEPHGDSLTAANSITPIAYNDLRADTVVTKSFNRLGLAVGAGVRHLTYEDGTSASGAPIDQSYRDGTIITSSLMPFYEFSPGYRAFTRLEVNQQDYQGTGTLNRDSEGYTARGGVEFLISSMLFGSVAAGYLDQRYSNPDIPEANGPSILSQLTWLMTPLMTVSLFASRSVAGAAAEETEARVDLTGGLQLDYEIRRNLIATLGASFTNENFKGTSRLDDVLNIKAGLDYSMNEYMHFSIRYSYLDRQSNISSDSFNQHQVLVSIIAQY